MSYVILFKEEARNNFHVIGPFPTKKLADKARQAIVEKLCEEVDDLQAEDWDDSLIIEQLQTMQSFLQWLDTVY